MLLSWCVDTCSIAHGSCQGRNGTGPIPWERVAGCEASPIGYGRTLLAKVPSRDGLRGLIARPYIGSGISLQANSWIRALEPNGDMPRWRPGLPCGRAEPAPPRGGLSRARWPSGGRSEMTRKAIFSEGRTPCVRIARPCPCRGILLVEMVGRTAPGLTGMCLVQAKSCFNGRAEPAPPRGGQAQCRSPSGKAPR